MATKRAVKSTDLKRSNSEIKLFVQEADVRIAAVRKNDIELSEQDLTNIAAVISKVAKPLKDVWATVQPDNASIEFGLALEGSSGALAALLVNGKAAAHLTVTMSWGEKK